MNYAPAVLEKSTQTMQVPPARTGAPVPEHRPRRVSPVANLSAGMLENNRMTRPKRAIDFVLSILAHTALVAVAILVPLYFTNAIDLPQMEATYLVAPAPPPPPPPPAPSVAHVFRQPRMLLSGSTLYAPRMIPKVVAQIKDLGTAPQMTEGVPGGVPGGIPGGQLGGVLGGIIGGSTHFLPPTPTPPPPKPVVHSGPYRVGGRVRPPSLIHEVQPTYPALAKQVHVQGNVVLDCVIDKQGNVTEIKVVSGHPLLIAAAMNAVSQWKYNPTLLNGQPVEVELLATVHFTLNS